MSHVETHGTEAHAQCISTCTLTLPHTLLPNTTVLKALQQCKRKCTTSTKQDKSTLKPAFKPDGKNLQRNLIPTIWTSEMIQRKCNDYIQGINNVTLSDAVKTMHHMHIVHIHTNYHQLLDQNLDAARKAGQKSPGFVKVWEKTKKKVERDALEKLRNMELEYWALPAKRRNAEMCACGKVLLKDWMAVKK
ncbi:hypothetical protein SpCBS45565_g05907 [Spizellomyces sp. 'palustris']|nr:hypothetical protein SpCBS45565_g05907 [Spizellomyces sp. 'palustris']